MVFYDAGRMSIASRGLQSPAGISAAPDYQFIYISEMLARRLDTFVGDPFTGELTKRNELAIPTMLDNIDVDSDGFVWVAGHPKGLPRSAHALSPSEIWKVQILHGIPISARRFYANLGDQISAASVGAKQGEHIYIGSVTDTKVLDCTLPPGTT